jgi:outer membrane protein assembly factor BamB
MIRSAPVIVDGVLIVASYDGKIYGLAPRTGEERWYPIDLGAPILAHPWVEGNIVYLIDRQNTLHAIEAETGSIVWQIPVGQKREP